MEPTRLESLKAITDPAERAVTAGEYIKLHRKAADDAIAVRDGAILELLATKGPTEVARLVGLSVSHIKLLRGRA